VQDKHEQKVNMIIDNLDDIAWHWIHERTSHKDRFGWDSHMSKDIDIHLTCDYTSDEKIMSFKCICEMSYTYDRPKGKTWCLLDLDDYGIKQCKHRICTDCIDWINKYPLRLGNRLKEIDYVVSPSTKLHI
jgi:hypothetical protein